MYVNTEFDRRQSFLATLNCEQGSPHLIKRSDIYADVLKLYSSFSRLVNEYPFRIAFDDEEAIDTGGVCRDMFSGFWKSAFDKLFDGSGSLVPATHPGVDMGAFPIIGTILSHGYIVCGFVPVHISFPVLASILLGPTVQISNSILCGSFVDFLSNHDSSILKDGCLELGKVTFSPKTASSLLSLLSVFGSRKVPSPQNLMALVTNVARQEFLLKPLGALYAMNKGIPIEHQSFWESVTVDEFLKVYIASTPTAASILNVISEPSVMDAAETTVFGYLNRYVGNMRNKEVRNFLRFVTGSSALVVDKINIRFNGLSGLSRRPIAHTCGCMLELPTSYATSLEFSMEFDSVLSSETAWIMNSL